MLYTTYLRYQHEEDFLELKASLKNVLKNPVRGRAATDEYVDADGETVPAQPAVGDPLYWYCFARAPFPITQYNGMEVVDEATGSSLCGT